MVRGIVSNDEVQPGLLVRNVSEVEHPFSTCLVLGTYKSPTGAYTYVVLARPHAKLDSVMMKARNVKAVSPWVRWERFEVEIERFLNTFVAHNER